MPLQRRWVKQIARKSGARKLPSQLVVSKSDRYESVVIGLDANSAEEACEWFEYAVDSAGAVLASAKQFLNQRSPTASRVSGDLTFPAKSYGP